MEDIGINLRNLGRARGDSVIEVAAHLAGIDLFDVRTNRLHRGSRADGILSSRMLAPADAPRSALDVESFWIASEHFEPRANARLGRLISLPLARHLSLVGQSELASQIGEMLVARYSAVILAAVHKLSSAGIEAHFLLSARQVRQSGFGSRAGAMFDAGSGSGAKEIAALTELVNAIIRSYQEGGGSAPPQAQADASLIPRPDFRVPRRPLTPLDAAQIEMQLALARADARGVLVPTSPGHSHAAAFADRIYARRAAPPPAALLVRESGPPASWMARNLGRLARKARNGQDSWARLLGSESELLGRWRDSILTAGSKARSAAMISPGTQLDQGFLQALAALEVDRAPIYGMRPFFFLDIEALSSTVTTYAAALRAPHDDMERVMRARVQLTQAINPAERASSAAIRAAREAFDIARAQTTDAAKTRGQSQLREARREMREAREHVEHHYHITQAVLIDPDPFAAFDEPPDGGARSSDSHQRQLRPTSSTGPGR
ncbi:MobA/MobL family protein [Luteimonas fraxinea]|uniref:MobA/MobL family protein n=1 Tax=Luteimonas fraxinea TaxID=2901869 RepID=UPI001E3FC17C|nr:MobA/MobL family protein [Luteimonas fraxinea]UHH09659.1 MobA/MobL family protein [Luteimonas fraxinea]